MKNVELIQTFPGTVNGAAGRGCAVWNDVGVIGQTKYVPSSGDFESGKSTVTLTGES